MAEEKKIATGYIGNALRSSAADHTTTFTDEVFDTERQRYQNEVTADLETKIENEAARAKAAEEANTQAIAKRGIYDVSAYNSGAVFESLSALFNDANLSTLIPASVRCGGMSIRFIQSSVSNSDNKYVQYLYVGTSTTVADFTNVLNWEKINLEKDINSVIFVKCNITKIQRFFKELYIVPVNDSFDIEDISKVSLYRQPSENKWRIQFLNDSGDILCGVESAQNIETDKIYFLPTFQTTNKFNAYIVADWNELNQGDYFYQKACTINPVSLSLDFNPSIKTYLERNKDFYELPAEKYNNLLDAISLDNIPIKDRTIQNLTIRFYNKTSEQHEIWFYNYSGNNPEYSDNFLNVSNWEKINLEKDINSVIFVKCNITKIQRFFKELYIVPVNDSFDIEDISKVSLYRQPSENKWRIQFLNDSGDILCGVESAQNIETDKIYFLPTFQTTNKFNAYIVADWNELNQGDYFYQKACTINPVSLSLDFNPSIKTYLERNKDFYELPAEKYNNLLDAISLDNIPIKDRTIQNLTIRFYNKTSEQHEIWLYNYSGNNPEYNANFLNVLNWSKVNSDEKRIPVHTELKPSLLKWQNGGINYKDGTENDTYTNDIRTDFIQLLTYNQLAGILSTTTTSFKGRVFLYNANKEFIRNFGWNTLGEDKYEFLGRYNTDAEIAYARFVISGTGVQQLDDKDETGISFWIISTEKKPKKVLFANYSSFPIAAHKGCICGGYTAGSPRAYANAKRLGYEWIETDIQFTSDGVPVFIHDKPINSTAAYIVNKSTGIAPTSSDNIFISNMTFADLRATYMYADGGEIPTLTEGLNQIANLGMRVILEFKEEPTSIERWNAVIEPCKQFGIENIIWSAGLSSYQRIANFLIESDVYYRGYFALTGGNETDINNLFAFAKDIGNTSVYLWLGGSYGGLDVNPDSEFMQNKLKEYGVSYAGETPVKKNTSFPMAMLISNNYVKEREYYPNNQVLISQDDIDYSSAKEVGSVTFDKPTNLSVSMVADNTVGVYITGMGSDVFYGCANFARVVAAGTYKVYIIGTGKVSDLIIKY